MKGPVGHKRPRRKIDINYALEAQKHLGHLSICKAVSDSLPSA